MNWSEVGSSACPIARALAAVGDRWTMLILRELFLGSRRYDAFLAQTGMSSHLLASRLKRLEGAGIVARQRYSTRPARYEYRLTDKGLDFYPVLLSLKAWGEKWGGFAPEDEAALVLTHKRCGRPAGNGPLCASCGAPFGPKDVTVALGGRFRAERQARAGDAR